MPAATRSVDAANQRAKRVLQQIGDELRAARVTRGLSQATVARAIGVSQAQVSLIERRAYPSAVGLELAVRTFPGGQPIRDRAHIALLDRFKAAIGGTWTWASEVPLPITGDRRAWDRTIQKPGILIGVEAETHPNDMQELGRRLALKKRDGGVDAVILVMPNSRWCRQLVELNDVNAAFPVPRGLALAALKAGLDPGGDAIILV